MTTSDLVPREFPIGINGTPFQLDETSNAFGVNTIPVLQRIPYAQSDASTTDPSARQSRFTDWSHGAGQTWWDDPAADQARFRQSQGVDVWTPGQLSLLKDTSNLQSAGTNYSTMVFRLEGSTRYIYYLDGAPGSGTFKRITISNTDTISAGPTSITGLTTSAGNAAMTTGHSVTSDQGFRTFFVDGNTRIDYVSSTSTAITNLCNITAASAQITMIGYANGHLLAASGPGFLVFDCTGGGSIASATLSINAQVGALVDFAEGDDVIYISGNLDGRAVVYSVAPDASTTALTNLKRAAILPYGETIYATYGYSGFLLIGTDRGVRTCAQLSDGTLQVGALIDIGKPVRCFTAIGKYVYFGWSQFDGSTGGMGRINLETFVDGPALLPAYASDSLAVTTNNIIDMIAFDNGAGTVKPYFITSDKLWKLSTSPVASGTIDLGFATYNLTEQKTATAVDLRTEALPANSSVAVSLTNVHAGTPASVSTYSTTSGTGTLMNVANIVGSEHEIRLTLATTGTAPVVTATTLQATPRPTSRGELWKIPVIIGTDIADNNGNNKKFDPFTVIAMLRTAANSTDPVDVQIGTYTDTMLVDDFEFHGYSWLIEGAPAMTGLITLKNLAP